MSPTVFIVSSLTYALFEIVVYLPSISHVPVAATLGQTPLGRGRMSNAMLIGTVSGVATVVSIMAGAIVLVMRTRPKDNTSNCDGEPSRPAECHCHDSSGTAEQRDGQLGIELRYSCDQTVITCEFTQPAEHNEPLFV
jgi:hypothetical protein